jgi:AcrR family transcriptional regulator
VNSDQKRLAPERPSAVRQRILATASKLFYEQGVHAVGVDLVVVQSGIAKTSLYRHFGSKDALVAAFLAQEDADFWRQWDAIAERHQRDPEAELEAYLDWMEVRLRRTAYRGCPQLNVAAELPDPKHPARRVAEAHKDKMRRQFSELAKRLHLRDPEKVGAQFAMAFDGAFISAPLSDGKRLAATLRDTIRVLSAAARTS